jgi:hypothetical protein
MMKKIKKNGAIGAGVDAAIILWYFGEDSLHKGRTRAWPNVLSKCIAHLGTQAPGQSPQLYQAPGWSCDTVTALDLFGERYRATFRIYLLRCYRPIRVLGAKDDFT